MEMRCDAKLHGVVIADGIVEVKCSSRFCGARPGRVVLHFFSGKDGHLIGTTIFRDSNTILGEGVNNDGMGRRTTVRSA